MMQNKGEWQNGPPELPFPEHHLELTVGGKVTADEKPSIPNFDDNEIIASMVWRNDPFRNRAGPTR